MFILQTAERGPIVGFLHDCLLSQGSPFNLLSVSQFQACAPNSVDFSVGSPHLSTHSRTGQAIVPLTMDEGLYGFLAEPIHPSDDRYRTLPRFDLTSKGPHLLE